MFWRQREAEKSTNKIKTETMSSDFKLQFFIDENTNILFYACFKG